MKVKCSKCGTTKIIKNIIIPCLHVVFYCEKCNTRTVVKNFNKEKVK
jgi:late competence protein required for DNA uptake (superfamily II DNA/RNA helicase)